MKAKIREVFKEYVETATELTLYRSNAMDPAYYNRARVEKLTVRHKELSDLLSNCETEIELL